MDENFKVHSANKPDPLIKRPPKDGATGDATQQDKRPPQKGDTVTISDEAKEKDAEQRAGEDDVSGEFEESAQGKKAKLDEQDEPKVVYDKTAKTYVPDSEQHPTIDLSS